MRQTWWMLITMASIAVSQCSQTSNSKNNMNEKNQGRIGGPCEDCQAIYESPVAFDKLESMTWLPDFKEGENTLAVNGTVYNQDGTPAPGVVIYIYHTDQTGAYPTRGDEKGYAKRHGYLRGWMKTDEKGFYKFFTLIPASYPGTNNPKHIHVTIKEPNKNEYWIDDFHFDDDPLLTKDQRKHFQDRGGSGILITPATFIGKKNLKAERNIYLGKNIPNYPK